MDLQNLTLPNGIRVIHREVSGAVAHCGVFIGAGTRDEGEDEHGIAHFIEHTIFKGTEKRNLFHILNRLENVGADLNAYTSKEETCIHASFLKEYYGRTLELFQDILFHSVFPAKEIEKEKQVVIDEIRSYQDTPSEQILDDFEDLVFTGHPLGKNILGTRKSVGSFTPEHIRRFIGHNYRPERIVIASVGNISFRSLERMMMRYFNQGPGHGKSRTGKPVHKYVPVTRTIPKKIFQVHCVIGAPGYCFTDDRRIPLALLNNMFGGPVLNSRLSLALRERNGLTYHNESSYTAYSDAGIVSIYFGTDPRFYSRALEVVQKELKRIRSEKLSVTQLHTIRKQLVGQLAISRESNLGQMMAIGKSYLLRNRYEPFEAIVKAIENTTAEQLREIANDIFNPSGLSLLSFIPKS
jgi:predicted Zn-dependent peptidase